MRILIKHAAPSLVLVALVCGATKTVLLSQSGNFSGSTNYGVTVRDKEVVLFPFDHDAIPFRSGLQLSLVNAHKYKENPVVGRGEAGSPDSVAVAFYGTAIRIGNQFRMWYLGAGGQENAPGFSWLRGVRWRICYATSTDGIHWEKPHLGLVEYRGNTQNNLVRLDPTGSEVSQSVIIYDPEDPNSARHFKMIYENYGGIPNGENSAAFSPDGLTWTNSPGNPVITIPFEPSGLIKYNGLYYLAGHSADFTKRLLAVHASGDFEHWTDGVAVGLRRDNFGPLQPVLSGRSTGEQIHLGAALWDRGNVILGLYGQWHGPSPESGDRRDMRMDIGFVVSHDALHYDEPIPGFKMISAADERFPELGFVGRLVQSQAFLNVGDQTYTYYSLWGPSGADGIYLASWQRDRLGYYAITDAPVEGQKPAKGVDPHFISCPIVLDKPQTRVYLNAGGLGQYTQATVELLDYNFHPIPGYSGVDSIPLTTAGLHEEVKWRNKDGLPQFDHPIRLRVTYGGLQREWARIYAVYLD